MKYDDLFPPDQDVIQIQTNKALWHLRFCNRCGAVVHDTHLHLWWHTFPIPPKEST